MDNSNQGNKLIHYGIPVLILMYFAVAFYPKYIGDGNEIVPFSLFNMYTFIPYDYTNYDFRITEDNGKSRFLYFGNQNFSKVERKYYLSWLREIGEEHRIYNAVNIDSTHSLIQSLEGQVEFVKLSGDYIETFKKGDYEMEILKRIK